MKATTKTTGHSNPNCSCNICLCGPSCTCGTTRK